MWLVKRRVDPISAGEVTRSYLVKFSFLISPHGTRAFFCKTLNQNNIVMKLIKGRKRFEVDPFEYCLAYTLLGAVAFGIMYVFFHCYLIAGVSIGCFVISGVLFILAISR